MAQAWLRSAVDIALVIVNICAITYVLMTWTGPEWSSLDWVARGEKIAARRHPLSTACERISGVWLWSELGILLLNKKRRALHDFIAGTVVIKIPPRLAPASASTPAAT